MVLQSMKRGDEASAMAATAPAPVPPDAQDIPPTGGDMTEAEPAGG